MRILVFGASGQTGREVVIQAVARGHSVTAFVRTPSKVTLAHSSLRLVEGNVANADTVSHAVRGHDAVVSTLGVGTPLKPDADVVVGVQHIIQAMRQAGVKRIVYQSFIGVRESRAAVGFVLRFIAPIPLRHEIEDHEAKEALVRASGLDWTIVRPPKLTNGAATGRFRHGLDISTLAPVPSLSRADVAGFMVGELEQPRYLCQAPRLLK